MINRAQPMERLIASSSVPLTPGLYGFYIYSDVEPQASDRFHWFGTWESFVTSIANDLFCFLVPLNDPSEPQVIAGLKGLINFDTPHESDADWRAINDALWEFLEPNGIYNIWFGTLDRLSGSDDLWAEAFREEFRFGCGDEDDCDACQTTSPCNNSLGRAISNAERDCFLAYVTNYRSANLYLDCDSLSG